MDLTITSKRASNTWKQIKLQHISVACCLAIAAYAAVALASWEPGSAAPPARPARTAISVSQPDQTPNQLVIFISGSQQQASDHAAQLYQDLKPAWYGAYSFVVVTNAEEAADVHYGQAEAAIENPDLYFQIIDLRGH